MGKLLDIALLQSDLHWENPEANLSAFEQKLKAIDGADLIILPEMFNTAFSPFNEANAEPMDGMAVSWLKQKAAETQAVICTSVLIKEKGKLFNRLFWMKPDGSYSNYDKKHLFRMGREDEYITAGDGTLVAHLKDWNIMPLICYDLRFPCWSRNTYRDGKFKYDLLIYTANWPAVRAHVWKSLLLARALENQCYVAGVNRVGTDGQGFDHSGNSLIIDPKGNVLASSVPSEEKVLRAKINLEELQQFRDKFRVSLDWDSVSIS